MKKTSIIKAVLSAILISVIGLSFCSCGVKSKINLRDYIQLEFSGLDGKGKMSYNVDRDALNAQIPASKAAKYFAKLNKKTVKGKDDTEARLYAMDYESPNGFFSFFCLEWDGNEYSDYSDLSNGDKITVTVNPSDLMLQADQTFEDVEKALGISVDKTLEFTVEGLTVPQKINFFPENMKDYVIFSGANDSASAEIEFPDDFTMQVEDYILIKSNSDRLSIVKDNCVLDGISFNLFCPEGKTAYTLTKGDVITIKMTSNFFDRLEKENIIPAKDTMEITVPDLGDYILNSSEITAEELNAIKKEVSELIYGDGSVPAEIEGWYFGTVKPESVVNKDERLKLTAIFTRQYLFSTRKEITVDGIKRNADGKLEYKINNSGYCSNGVESLNSRWTYSEAR